MTNRPALLRQIYTEARPYVEQLVELNVAFTDFRKLATDNGLDWGQIKALLRAEIEDGEEGGSEKVDRIIKKAEYAGEYAALLGLGTSNMNEQNSISSSSQGGVVIARPMGDVASGEAAFTVSPSLPPHDEDGVIIELPPAETVRPSADIQGSGPPSEENGPLLNNVPGNGPATAPAPGAEGLSLKGDAGETTGEATPHMLAASSINSDPHGVASEEGADAIALNAPSSPSHSPSGELTATGTNGGSHAHEVASIPDTKSSDNRQVLDVPSGAVPGSAVESGAQVSQSGASLTPDAPVEAIGPPEPPGAPPSSPVDEWADLDIPARFDRREKAA